MSLWQLDIPSQDIKSWKTHLLVWLKRDWSASSYLFCLLFFLLAHAYLWKRKRNESGIPSANITHILFDKPQSKNVFVEMIIPSESWYLNISTFLFALHCKIIEMCNGQFLVLYVETNKTCGKTRDSGSSPSQVKRMATSRIWNASGTNESINITAECSEKCLRRHPSQIITFFNLNTTMLISVSTPYLAKTTCSPFERAWRRATMNPAWE